MASPAPESKQPMALSNREIADVLAAIGDMLEILSDVRFKVQEYRTAARSIECLSEPASLCHGRGELGAAAELRPMMVEQVSTLLGGGTISEYLRQLTPRPPPDQRVLLRPASLRMHMGRQFAALGIRDVADLVAAARTGRLATIAGLSDGTSRRISKAGDQLLRIPIRSLLNDARQNAMLLIDEIAQQLPQARPVIVGSIRRAEPLIDGIELLVLETDVAQLCMVLEQSQLVSGITGSTADRIDLQLCNRQHATVFVASADAVGGASHLRIGSRAYAARLQQYAAHRGYQLHDDGRLERRGALVACPDEATFDAWLELPSIADELREDADVIDWALAGWLPPLVSGEAMYADLHLHTTWSDGSSSIAEMAAAAQARGDQLMAVTDHSWSEQFRGINGLDAARLRQQAQEIATLNASYAAAGAAFRILHGVEVDIFADGSLGLDDATLAQLDIVVASPHSDLNQDTDDATRRLLRAIAHPYVDIIGHPTGRLLGTRRGLQPDVDALARAAAQHDTLLEINCGPDRLDLDAQLVRRGLAHGARFVINSDAHDTDGLSLRGLGIATARRAALPATAVANTWQPAQLVAWLAARRRIHNQGGLRANDIQPDRPA